MTISNTFKVPLKHLSVLLFSLFTVSAFAQDSPAKMEKLSFLIADWSILEDAEGDGTPVTTDATITWAHDGKFIEERAKYLTHFGEINMISFIGFDSRADSYKLTAMDKEYGMMDVYLGDWEDDQLVFTNINSDKPIQVEDGKQLNFRLTYFDMADNSFRHKVEGTYDQGKTWFTFSVSQYTRKN